MNAKLSAMQLIPARSWSLVLLSSLLQVLVFPIAGPLPLWRVALCWFALAPLLLALIPRHGEKPISVPAAGCLGYLCGILWYMGSCSWIYQTMYLYGGLPKPVAAVILVLFSLYLGLYHAAFAVLLVLVGRSKLGPRGALVASPFVWVGIELLRARLTGFPWDLLGNAQVDNLLLTRLAPLVGVMGLSFAIMLANAAFAGILLSRGKGRIAKLCIASAIVFALQIGSSFAVKLNTAPSTASQTAVMMQENLAVGVTARGAPMLNQQEELDLFSRLSLIPHHFLRTDDSGMSRSSQAMQPTVVIWPEAPSHLQSDDPSVRARLAELARNAGAPLIAGGLGVDRDAERLRGYSVYDSAMLFDRTGESRGRYDKIHLVPWGEFIPFKEFFSFAHKLTEGAGDMDRGYRRSIFRTDNHSFGVFICYESIFGDEVREFVKNGAEVLVNISDDGWYGDTGAPWQHLNMARMRAIENHRWVLRSTNTGITTAIDPWGRISVEAPRHVRAAFAFPFGFESNLTFYTLHGDWFAYLCAAVAIGLTGFCLSPLGALKSSYAE